MSFNCHGCRALRRVSSNPRIRNRAQANVGSQGHVSSSECHPLLRHALSGASPCEYRSSHLAFRARTPSPVNSVASSEEQGPSSGGNRSTTSTVVDETIGAPLTRSGRARFSLTPTPSVRSARGRNHAVLGAERPQEDSSQSQGYMYMAQHVAAQSNSNSLLPRSSLEMRPYSPAPSTASEGSVRSLGREQRQTVYGSLVLYTFEDEDGNLNPRLGLFWFERRFEQRFEELPHRVLRVMNPDPERRENESSRQERLWI